MCYLALLYKVVLCSSIFLFNPSYSCTLNVIVVYFLVSLFRNILIYTDGSAKGAGEGQSEMEAWHLHKTQQWQDHLKGCFSWKTSFSLRASLALLHLMRIFTVNKKPSGKSVLHWLQMSSKDSTNTKNKYQLYEIKWELNNKQPSPFLPSYPTPPGSSHDENTGSYKAYGIFSKIGHSGYPLSYCEAKTTLCRYIVLIPCTPVSTRLVVLFQHHTISLLMSFLGTQFRLGQF